MESLDLVNGFDVTDPAAWERVGAVDLALLNAGILTAQTDVRELVDRRLPARGRASTSTASCSASAGWRR